eukprot:6344286-Lingulodinium_polyedra.AAC.1
MPAFAEAVTQAGKEERAAQLQRFLRPERADIPNAVHVLVPKHLQRPAVPVELQAMGHTPQC